jgi:hypothetical protein
MARKQLTSDNLGHMEIDEQTGELSWKGASVKTRQVHGLRHYEFVLAAIAAIGTLLSGLHPFIQSLGYFN